MLFDAMYPLAFGRNPAVSPEAGPSAGDMWIAEQAYEFVAARSLCDKCGAGLRRKLDLAVLPDDSEPTWLIAVGARCRSWRRHRHSAVVRESRDGLRFGALRSC
jgi:hypothetical protein